jgi:hypothetical protein
VPPPGECSKKLVEKIENVIATNTNAANEIRFTHIDEHRGVRGKRGMT